MSQNQRPNKEKYYFQKGGAMRMPYRFYNANAEAFQPCGCQKMSSEEKSQQEGGAIRMPYRYFHADASPFQACGCAMKQSGGCGCAMKQSGGCGCAMKSGGCGCAMKSGGCGCAMKSGGCGKPWDAIYYNEFRRHEGDHVYNSSNMSVGGAQQFGGNPIQAPLHVFTEGEPLKYNFKMKDNFTGAPAFDRVGHSHFW